MKIVVCPFCNTECEMEDADFVVGAVANCPSCGKDFPLSLSSAKQPKPDNGISIGPKKRNPNDERLEDLEYVPKYESKAPVETFKRPTITKIYYALAIFIFVLVLLGLAFAIITREEGVLATMGIATFSGIALAAVAGTVGWFAEVAAKIEYNTRQGGKK